MVLFSSQLDRFTDDQADSYAYTSTSRIQKTYKTTPTTHVTSK